MRLTVFNGSPRRGKSNTQVFLEQFIEGFNSADGCSNEYHYIYPVKERDKLLAAFTSAEVVLIGFPLYVDAMPSGVMEFFELLSEVKGRQNNPALGFFVQSGFPEAFHSRFVERYLTKLSARLGCRYYGTIIKGGGEGIKEMPPVMTNNIFSLLRALGAEFAETGELNQKLLRKLAGKEKFGFFSRQLAKLLYGKLVGKIFWNNRMKANGVLDQALARPYETSDK